MKLLRVGDPGQERPAVRTDDGRLLDALLRFVPDEKQRNGILVDNPRRLLGLKENNR